MKIAKPLDSDDLKWVKQQQDKIQGHFKLDRDRYNTVEETEEESHYKHILNSQMKTCPKRGQTWQSFLTELRIYMKMASDKNIKTHIIIGSHGKPWYTHSRPDCFMCDDINLIHTMYSVMLLMAEQYPKNQF